MIEIPEISIIIPAYNEEKIIVDTIQRISVFFKNKNHEIIVVDDGSSDNTFNKVFALSFPTVKIIRNYRNFGKGYAVKRGMLHSSGKFVFFTDADLSTPLEEFFKLEDAINNGYDIAVASRCLRDSRVEKRQSFLRELLGKFYGVFARPLVSYSIMDTQCGFKLFGGDVARKIFSSATIDGYSFDIDIILIAKKYEFKIKEVPVRWKNHVKSNIRLLSSIYFKIIVELFRIFLKKKRGYY